MAEIQIREIDFLLASKIWSEHLWPNRISPIEPTSWIDITGEINPELKMGTPTFLGAFIHESIKGIISGFATSNTHYRSRGIWVEPGLRGCGIGRLLLGHLETQSLKENKSIIWTMPRLTALPFYEKLGFTSGPLLYQYEFGPHVLANKQLKLT